MSAPRPLPARAWALAAVALLAGCGQKGPLYLPHPPAGVQRPTLPEIIRSSVTGEAIPAQSTPPASAMNAASSPRPAASAPGQP